MSPDEFIDLLTGEIRLAGLADTTFELAAGLRHGSIASWRSGTTKLQVRTVVKIQEYFRDQLNRDVKLVDAYGSIEWLPTRKVPGHFELERVCAELDDASFLIEHLLLGGLDETVARLLRRCSTKLKAARMLLGADAGTGADETRPAVGFTIGATLRDLIPIVSQPHGTGRDDLWERLETVVTRLEQWLPSLREPSQVAAFPESQAALRVEIIELMAGYVANEFDGHDNAPLSSFDFSSRDDNYFGQQTVLDLVEFTDTLTDQFGVSLAQLSDDHNCLLDTSTVAQLVDHIWSVATGNEVEELVFWHPPDRSILYEVHIHHLDHGIPDLKRAVRNFNVRSLLAKPIQIRFLQPDSEGIGETWRIQGVPERHLKDLVESIHLSETFTTWQPHPPETTPEPWLTFYEAVVDFHMNAPGQRFETTAGLLGVSVEELELRVPMSPAQLSELHDALVASESSKAQERLLEVTRSLQDERA